MPDPGRDCPNGIICEYVPGCNYAQCYHSGGGEGGERYLTTYCTFYEPRSDYADMTCAEQPYKGYKGYERYGNHWCLAADCCIAEERRCGHYKALGLFTGATSCGDIPGDEDGTVNLTTENIAVIVILVLPFLLWLPITWIFKRRLWPPIGWHFLISMMCDILSRGVAGEGQRGEGQQRRQRSWRQRSRRGDGGHGDCGGDGGGDGGGGEGGGDGGGDGGGGE